MKGSVAFMDFVSFLIISLVVGGIAGLLAGRHINDWGVNVVIGALGGLIGGFWFSAWKITGNNDVREILGSVFGAVLFILISHLAPQETGPGRSA